MSGRLEIVDEIDSTQSELARRIAAGAEFPAALAARSQSQGRGRFARAWVSPPETSLSLSIPFPSLVGHAQPWLLGMAAAIAGANTIHCRLQWPNDLMIGPKKVGGVLIELLPNAEEKLVPVVGIGINLAQTKFPPEISHRATSLLLERGYAPAFETVAESILRKMEAFTAVKEWTDLAPIWMELDETPGKRYLLPNGEESVALGIGPSGELLCAVDGETTSVMAAEAIFGEAAS